MSNIAERLREVFRRRRYGHGDDYDPDFDLFDVAADEIERLRAALGELADLMEDTVAGRYKPDSFTTQPARAALEHKP